MTEAKWEEVRPDPGVDEGARPCSLPPSPPTPWPAPNLPPTFLLLPDESTRGSSPAAAGSRRVPASSGRLHQQWPEWQWREWPTPPPLPATWTRQGRNRRSRIKNGGGSLRLPRNLVHSKTPGRSQRPYTPTTCWIGLLIDVQQLVSGRFVKPMRKNTSTWL